MLRHNERLAVCLPSPAERLSVAAASASALCVVSWALRRETRKETNNQSRVSCVSQKWKCTFPGKKGGAWEGGVYPITLVRILFLLASFASVLARAVSLTGACRLPCRSSMTSIRHSRRRRPSLKASDAELLSQAIFSCRHWRLTTSLCVPQASFIQTSSRAGRSACLS